MEPTDKKVKLEEDGRKSSGITVKALTYELLRCIIAGTEELFIVLKKFDERYSSKSTTADISKMMLQEEKSLVQHYSGLKSAIGGLLLPATAVVLSDIGLSRSAKVHGSNNLKNSWRQPTINIRTKR